jgi:hypothetical protein
MGDGGSRGRTRVPWPIGARARGAGEATRDAFCVQQLRKKNDQLDRMMARVGTAGDTRGEQRERLAQLRAESKDLCQRIISALKSPAQYRCGGRRARAAVLRGGAWSSRAPDGRRRAAAGTARWSRVSARTSRRSSNASPC